MRFKDIEIGKHYAVKWGYGSIHRAVAQEVRAERVKRGSYGRSITSNDGVRLKLVNRHTKEPVNREITVMPNQVLRTWEEQEELNETARKGREAMEKHQERQKDKVRRIREAIGAEEHQINYIRGRMQVSETALDLLLEALEGRDT